MKPFDIEQAKIGAEKIAKKYGLSFVVLFGSQVAGGVHEKSDVDVAVLGFGEVDRTKVACELDEIFKRDDTEVVVLNDASPTIMYVVARDGRVLYEDTVGRFASWKLYAMREWRDTAWLRVLRDRKLTEWAKVA